MRLFVVTYLLFVGTVAVLAQMVLPAHYPILSDIGVGSALVPLVVIYASLELGDESAPVLAGILGLFLDLTSSHHLGTSVLILSSLSALIVSQAQKPESHLWIFRLTFVLVGTFAYLLLDYIFILAETFRWYWPLSVWSKITFASLLNLALCPFIFPAVGFLPWLCGWRPEHESTERSYAP